MTTKTRKTIVFLALPLAIVWAVYNYQPNDKKKNQPPAADATITTAPLKKVPTPKSIPKKLIDIEKYEKLPWGKDPFHAKTQKQVTQIVQQDWLLSGIIYNANNPIAIINKKTVKTGDIVDNATVIEIARKKVVLNYHGNRITLTVAKG